MLILKLFIFFTLIVSTRTLVIFVFFTLYIFVFLIGNNNGIKKVTVLDETKIFGYQKYLEILNYIFRF